MSAAPHRHDKRGGCICTKTVKAGSQATGSSSSGGSAVVYADSGSSSGSSTDDTYDSTWDSSSSSWDEESSESSASWSYAGSAYHSVIYYSYVPVPVPCTTTCLTTGNIIIENDITINISIAPTVNISLVIGLISGDYLYNDIDIDCHRYILGTLGERKVLWCSSCEYRRTRTTKLRNFKSRRKQLSPQPGI